jgi:exodeoxyribonuclease V alpha subunit
MIDVELCDAMTRAIKPETRLILVGDVDQLPSVGAGNVLRDIIASRDIATVRLEQIYRQSERSYIAVNAGHINKGEDLELDPNAEDFFWHPHASADDAFAKALELVKHVIPERHGVDPIRDVQVLSPQRKGTLGIYHFNAELQPLLNPAVGMRPVEVRNRKGTVFRVGDKVRHTKNNYDLMVMNGEAGIVRSIDEVREGKKKRTETEVDFGDASSC